MPRDAALAAVGGYGRGELFPCSDVDLLILLAAPADAALARKLEELIGTLWDIGLEVGHSVRTIDECVALAASDVTVQTTLLEARLLDGQARALRALHEAHARRARSRRLPAGEARSSSSSATPASPETNLEPNVKESAGGLRDLQTMLWIARAAGIGTSWRALARRGVITAGEAREFQQHEQFLQELRIRLHYLAGRREDRLLFDHQTALAARVRPARPAASPGERAADAALLPHRQGGVAVEHHRAAEPGRARSCRAHDTEYHPINERFGVRDELLEALRRAPVPAPAAAPSSRASCCCSSTTS